MQLPRDVLVGHRITSYNVCYTKLLRFNPISFVRTAASISPASLRITSSAGPVPAIRSHLSIMDLATFAAVLFELV